MTAHCFFVSLTLYTHMKGGATVHGMILGFSPDMLEMLLLPSVASGRWEFMLEQGPQLA